MSYVVHTKDLNGLCIVANKNNTGTNQGCIGSWYSADEISLENYDKIEAAVNIEPGSSANNKVYMQLEQEVIAGPITKANTNSEGYGSLLADISNRSDSGRIVIRTNGGAQDNISMIISTCAMYSIK